jgi:hypothetical protein
MWHALVWAWADYLGGLSLTRWLYRWRRVVPPWLSAGAVETTAAGGGRGQAATARVAPLSVRGSQAAVLPAAAEERRQ